MSSKAPPLVAPGADGPSRLVFDHIPKTGGTSIKTALTAALGDGRDVAEESYPHHVALKAADGHRHLAAHLWYFPGEPLGSDWVYATLLRDPIDRFLSQYAFYRAHGASVSSGAITSPEVVAAVQLELADYLANGRTLRRGYANVQACHFAWRVCDAPERLSDRDLLAAAIAGLDGYDVIGVFADVQGFVDACCDVLAVSRQSVPHLNATPGRLRLADLAPAVLADLAGYNAVDAALYAWARQRWTTRPRARSTALRVRPLARGTAVRADFGNRQMEIVSSQCEGTGSGSATVRPGERVVVRLRGRSSTASDDLTVGIAVRDGTSRLVYATNTRLLGVPVAVSPGQELRWSFLLDGPLEVGEYQVTLALHRGLSHLDGCYHWLENATSFTVQDEGHRHGPT